VNSLDRPERLRLDLARGFVSAEAVADEAAPQPEELFKRVLVELSQDAVPEGWTDLNWNRIVDRTFTVTIPASRLADLARRPEVRYIEAGRPLVPMLNTSMPETRANLVHQNLNLRGNGIIVGIIDIGGIDYTLDDFRNADGTTRIAFLWDQRLTPKPGEQAPPGLTYGVEYNAAAIDQALNQPNPFQHVRHRCDIAQLGAPPSHATHVSSIATGNGRSGDAAFPANQHIGVAPEATIIFVEASTETGIGSFTDSVRVADAVAYIFRRAEEMGRPCVINMSLGQNGGSHDGESVVERAIDRLSEVPGRAFVLAAGNEHIFRGHASGTLAAGQTRALRWKFGGGLPWPGMGSLPPGIGDRTPSEMEIWYSSQDRLRVTVVAPGNQSVGPVDPGQTVNQALPGGVNVFIDSVRFTRLNGEAQIYIEVSPPAGGIISVGEWEVRLEARESQVGRFDAWIERDARDPNNNFGDQSYFVGTDFDPTMTLGTPGTGRRSIVVANYSHQAETPSDTSSRGPTRDGRSKPEVAAPGTNIFAGHSMGGRPRPAAMGGGVWPMRARMSGTSMAAPHVAGIVALMLQRNPQLTAEQLRKILITSARPIPGTANFDVAWGFGRVDASAALDLVPAP
jgi:subtilisin family serine protease